MFDFIASLLTWFYQLWPSYAGAIFLLTLLIMIVLAPLTVRQTKSMLAMQQLQPEVKRLRSKYGDNRELLNQELMALYQANGVNPLGGCLPILVQMPVLLVLYQIMRGLTRRVSGIGLRAGEAVVRNGEVTSLTDFPKRGFNPAYIDTDSELYHALTDTQVTEMKSLGFDLAQSATGAFGEGIITSIPYLLLVVGVGLSTWYQQRLVRARSGGAEMNAQQQAIMKYLPFMLPIFSLGFPAALVLYWFVSNVFRVGQQMFITWQVYGKNDSEAEIVRPEADRPDDDEDGDRPVRSKAKGPASDPSLHGSRAPVSGPAPKRKKTPPSKRTTDPTRERNPRPTSKRVTPKKADLEAEKSKGRGKAAAKDDGRPAKLSWSERLEQAAERQSAQREEKKKNKRKG